MRRRTFSLSALVPLFVAAIALPSCECGVEDSADSEPVLDLDPAHTVVVITIDSLSPRILMGESFDWDVAPAMHEVFGESVVLPKVLTPIGITRPALGALLTGLYPQEHGARTNTADLRDGTTLLRRFRDAGYTTFGFSSNQCPIIQDGDTDEYYCTWNTELKGNVSMFERDRLLVEELNTRLALVNDDDPIFVWLHLNNVHHPFIADDAVVDEFYGGTYTGFLNPSDDDMVADVTLGELSYSTDERHYLEATYAAQLRETDDMIASVYDTLRDLDRYDDAILVLGADHGEELAERPGLNYFWHGCSPYNSVLQVVYAIRAPGRIDGGQVLEDWVGLTDIGPTIVELAAAFEWSGDVSGSSLLDYFTGGAAPTAALFAGRGATSAVMLQGDHKYLLNEEAEYDACEPYAGTPQTYPGQLEELYDLSIDPDESVNIVEDDSDRADAMHTALCEWMIDVGWVPEEQADLSILMQECNDWLCGVGSDYCEE